MRKTVFIHLADRNENEEYGVDAGRARLFDLIHNGGYAIARSVLVDDGTENTVYVTLTKEVRA